MVTDPLAFGTRVLVHRTAVRVGVTHHEIGGSAWRMLRDRREPRDVVYGDIPPGWPGEPIPARDGYPLEPGPPGAYVRVRRIPLPFGPTVGIVLGRCVRYEGNYHSPISPGPWGEEWEPGSITNRRAVRLFEIALPPVLPSDTACLALAWHEDLESEVGQ